MKKLLFIIITLFVFKINAQEIKFGKVSKEELEEKSYPLDSTADAAYLLKKRKTHFSYEGNTGWHVVTVYHERLKIYTKKGLVHATKKILYHKPESGEKEKIKSISAYTFNYTNKKIEKQKLSKKDIFDEELNKYKSQKKITFPNVKKGSVIDLKYTLKSPYYWEIDDLNFQFGIPVKQLKHKIKIPEYFLFKKRQTGKHIPIKENTKNRKLNFSYRVKECFSCAKTVAVNKEVDFIENIIEISEKNIPALSSKEPFSGNVNNYRSKINLELTTTDFFKIGGRIKHYSQTWEDVCKTIYNSTNFGNELEKTNYYKYDLNKKLKSAKNDFEKIALIFDFIKTKVKWNNYYGKYTDKGVKKAYKEGTGNIAEINLMLTSMLRSAGIKANPVLISTKNNGIPFFSTIEGFNYVISKVNLSNGKYILLDATDKYSTINIIPYRALNWFGREILEGEHSQQVKLIPSTLTKENNILQVKINDLGEINGILRKSLTGHSAMFYRKKNNIRKEDDFISSLEEKYSVEIQEFKVFNKENISKPITQTLKFTSEDFIEEMNGKLYFSPLFFLGIKENPFKSEERNFPVDYGMPWQDKFSISITIPEGYLVESYPKNLAIGLPNDLGVFKYQINVQENKIKLSSVLQINSNIIAPQYYTTLKKFYNSLVKKQTEKIVIIKK